jgi:hypothetical protein
MTSPHVAQAAASTRTEGDIRAARAMSPLASAIFGIADAAAKAAREAKPCPFCGTNPLPAIGRASAFVVACENDDCAAQPMVTGRDLSSAWARWNGRAA